ncbi:MAG: bifunctional metallophosphatase/5'-nucleotidase [Lachnospiraceae bacterium]|nr:bifunctional metallophosphatase/5'-nucleotidase [Lachnospiraceae bacterium]
MKQWLKKLAILAACLTLLCSLGIVAAAEEDSKEVTILFTHDLHSHLLPSNRSDGGQFGGYARLMTVIQEQKTLDPDAILVDAGDFSMGSLFQTAYTTAATELRIMGAMGYDATTFGNHEFDYLPSGLVAMLNAAVASGDPLPAIVDANYLPPVEGQEGYDAQDAMVWEALDNYGVEDYVILERGGAYYVIFGLVGYDSDDCAPNSGMILEDPAVAAQRVVDEATAECVEKYGVEPLVIALSHSGTSGGQGEDVDLAQKVNGIHVIVSGHTHTILEQPLYVNNTYIVSCDEYGKNLGVIKMAYDMDGTAELINYELIPINEDVAEDPAMASLVEYYKGEVESNYLSKYGVSFDEVLLNNPYEFDSAGATASTAHESTLGNLFSDAYKWAVEQTTGLNVDVALTAAGVIRETIPVGNVTVSDVFNAASLGVGTEGELIGVYITGADLMNAFEVDASVYPLMHSAQLFMSGAEYSFNTGRMIFNKVDHAMLRRNDGTLEAIDKDKLYLVVTGMYAGQMLGSVEETSMGLLTITPRDAQGNPIAVADLKNYVVHDKNGNPLKEWYAITSYLKQMGGTMDEHYRQIDGRKVIYTSSKPADLLRNANKFTYLFVAVVMLLTVLAMVVSRWITRKLTGKKK